jgi:RimJ/RimL family protein N-acetyltransferase
VMRYLGATGQPLTRREAWQQMAMFLGHWQLRGYGLWAVEERASGTFVGRIGLYNPEGWTGLECMWTLARGAWGKGYATEGALRALEYAFTELNHARVISQIRPENTASIRVAERLGETLEGRAEVLGHEVLIYSISREQFRK